MQRSILVWALLVTVAVLHCTEVDAGFWSSLFGGDSKPKKDRKKKTNLRPFMHAGSNKRQDGKVASAPRGNSAHTKYERAAKSAAAAHARTKVPQRQQEQEVQTPAPTPAPSPATFTKTATFEIKNTGHEAPEDENKKHDFVDPVYVDDKTMRAVKGDPQPAPADTAPDASHDPAADAGLASLLDGSEKEAASFIDEHLGDHGDEHLAGGEAEHSISEIHNPDGEDTSYDQAMAELEASGTGAEFHADHDLGLEGGLDVESSGKKKRRKRRRRRKRQSRESSHDEEDEDEDDEEDEDDYGDHDYHEEL